MLVRFLAVVLFFASTGAFAKCEFEKNKLDIELDNVKTSTSFGTFWKYSGMSCTPAGFLGGIALNLNHEVFVKQLNNARNAYERCMERPESEGRRVQREDPERFKRYLEARNEMVRLLPPPKSVGGKVYVGLPDDHPVSILDRTWYL